MNAQSYDIVVIGGGPAGMTAGLYAGRSRFKTLLLEKMGCGGQAAITDLVENYPGFPEGIGGFELAARMEEQARKFGVEVKTEDVTGVTLPSKEDALFTVASSEGDYRARAIILASGAAFRTLGVPGEEEFRGRGVSYCATCDGPFFRDRDVVVVGGGDSAVQEALYLTRFARTVTIVHRRDSLRAARVLQERLHANDKIRVEWNAVVTSIEGDDGGVTGVRLRDVATGAERSVSAGGVFVFIGWTPNTSFVKGFVELDAAGYVVTDDHMNASVKGVFACGDVRKKILRQVVTAAGDGATAAFAAQEYLENTGG